MRGDLLWRRPGRRRDRRSERRIGPRPYTLVDVFTDVPLAGNGLAVVHGADGIDDETMLRFAREMRLSETSFIQTATVPGADYRNRIWTVTREVPFAGHPSVGAAIAVAKARGEQAARYVQQTPAGLQPVDVRIDDAGGFASVLQEPANFGPELAPEEVMRAIGLDAGAADRGRPPQFVTTGLDTLLVPVADAGSVTRARPDFERIAALSELDDFNTYVVALDRSAGAARARMFNGHTPAGEDPATGSAAGPLCAYLHAREGWSRVEIVQGVEMGRPSHLVAEVEGDRVRVGGGVVVVVEGSVYL